jgi:DNA-binding NarL/FixJ family response regulator
MVARISPIRQQSPELSQSIPSPDPGPLNLPDELWSQLARILNLSERESRIVQAICVDEEDKAIASRIGIPQERLYRAIQRIYVKLRIGSRAELKFMVRSVYLAHM